ncbi:MAG: prepilin-type N-terminal cleavage/methylation domain-containing protein [Candidatus Omnitrophica bacterium]|nr:prepilin-type N-terminal cleavage/methylation domain-containing protein [Candidatus Omnitrophota bacterium]
MISKEYNEKMIRKSFTILELLVSLMIFSLVSVAVYSVLSNGIAVWRKGNINNKQEIRVRIALEKMSRRLRNSFKFKTIPFEGTSESIKFPSFIERAIEDNNTLEMGQIIYFFNDNKKGLFQEEKTYPELFQQGENDSSLEIISGVKNWTFSYCYLDNATGEYKWKDDWKKEDQDTYPKAVRIECLIVLGGNIEKDISKIIFMPMGTGRQSIELNK